MEYLVLYKIPLIGSLELEIIEWKQTCVIFYLGNRNEVAKRNAQSAPFVASKASLNKFLPPHPNLARGNSLSAREGPRAPGLFLRHSVSLELKIPPVIFKPTQPADLLL